MSGRHQRSLSYWEQVARTDDAMLYDRWCQKFGHDPRSPFAAEQFVMNFPGTVERPPDLMLGEVIAPPKHRAEP